MKLIKKNKFEILIISIYSILLLMLLQFHEPWFDEAEAWMIAKTASFHDMLFSLPHYEGHPPFWWLLLSIPAKLGFPYEISIRTIQWCTSVIMISIFEFKAPLSKITKTIIPFTYFFFFQYAVIARPYTIGLIAFMLIASTWKERNNKPVQFVLSLGLLCMVSTYGIIISGGISLAWVIEFIRQEKSILRNKKRFGALLTLLIFALILIYLVIPAENCYAASSDSLSKDTWLSFLKRLYYFWFALPSESAYTTFAGDTFLGSVEFLPSYIFTMAIFSFIMWVITLTLTTKRKITSFFVIPFSLLSIVCAKAYFAMHHLGFIFMLFVFAFWISYEQQPYTIKDFYKELPNFLNEKTICIKLTKIIVPLFYCIFAVLSFYTTIIASIHDIEYQFSPAHILTTFIKENNLENYKWAEAWEITKDDNGNVIADNTHYVNKNLVDVNPYFNQNMQSLYYNGLSYEFHDIPTQEQANAEIESMKENGGPDILITSSMDGAYYLEKLGMKDVQMICLQTIHLGWKNSSENYDIYIYIKEDIYNSKNWIIPEG